MIFICVAAVTVLVNITVTMTIIMTKSLRTKTYYRGIACMTVLDFFTGSITIPLFCRVCDMMIDKEEPTDICTELRVAFIVAHILSGLSVNGMTFLCLERYFSICHAVKYQNIFNKRKSVMMATLLILPTVVSTILFALDMYDASNVIVTLEIMFLVVFGPAMYYKIFKTVIQSAAQAQRSTQSQQQKDMSKKLFVIVVVIIICYTPYGIVSNINEDPPGVLYHATLYTSLAFIALNSFLNPILFLWQDTFLRKGTVIFLKSNLSKFACCKCECLASSRISPLSLHSQSHNPSNV